jgi:ligand-binding SRPBCC domain-containing protein
MTQISLTTLIEAPVEICFDLSRSVEVHLKSTARTNEIAIAGRTTGLCELHDEITWQATHFGVRQKLSVRITKMEKPRFFEDSMLKGVFSSMRHEHHFEMSAGQTKMTDMFSYTVPFGFFGQLFDKLILKKYMTSFLLKRNQTIKDLAEEGEKANYKN